MCSSDLAFNLATGEVIPFFGPLLAVQFLIFDAGPMPLTKAVGLVGLVLVVGQAFIVLNGIFGNHPIQLLALLGLFNFVCFFVQARGQGGPVIFLCLAIAITVTLLVLEIRPPTDYSHLLHGLLALWPSYLAYAVTFLFIGQVWANHHVMFDHIRAADRVVLLLNTLLLMVVAFLPFATSVLAGAFRSGHGERTAVVFYGIAFVVTALTFNAVWQYARRHRLLSEDLDSAGATAIGRRFQLALAWLTTGALLGAVLPVLGVVVIAAFNAFYWLPIRGESPHPRPS